MANYTLCIYDILEDKVLYPDGIFPKDYLFYTNDAKIKKEFEELFLNHYMTSEIGFETVYRFQQAFKAKMMLITPMLKQRWELYQDWEKDLDYLYDTNDYTETRITDSTGSGISNTSSTNSGTSDTENKGSDTNNGIAIIDASEGNMTTNSITDYSYDNKGTSNSTSSNEGRVEDNFEHKEKRTSLMYPAADLVIKRRELLFDLNREIIEQCRDLFMMIY